MTEEPWKDPCNELPRALEIVLMIEEVRCPAPPEHPPFLCRVSSGYFNPATGWVSHSKSTDWVSVRYWRRVDKETEELLGIEL